MAFFEKLNTFAQNVGDKAGDAVEISKLNAKIKTEKNMINGLVKQIGDFYYIRHKSGAPYDPELAELYAQIDAHDAAILEAEAQLQAIKDQNEAASAVPGNAGATACAVCGASIAAGVKFCPSCGAKQEPPAPVQTPKPRFCSACGAPAAPGVLFCGECGTRFE